MNRKSPICTLNLSAMEIPAAPSVECPTRHRLAQAFTRLQNIELVRNHREDPEFGKAAESRIIWRELLELELQRLREQRVTENRDAESGDN